MKDKILSLIHEGILRIASAQEMDGGFTHLSTYDPLNFSGALQASTTFVASNILSCLTSLADCSPITEGDRILIKNISGRIVDFLLKEKSPRWTFNYWTKESKDHPHSLDDLDDTFIALAAIAKFDRSIITGECFAEIVKNLIALEAQAGGPYKTWIISPSEHLPWQSTDTIANSNAAYFLSLFEIKIFRVNEFIERSFEDGHLASIYYPSLTPVIYFISRFYKGKMDRYLKASALKVIESGPPITVLEKALAISSLINLGESNAVRPHINDLITIPPETIFAPYPFCFDPVRDGQKYYAGASSLTAGFVIEALGKYIANETSASTNSISKIHSKRNMDAWEDMHITIKKLAGKECVSLPSPLKTLALTEIEVINDERITSLAYSFAHALGERAFDGVFLEKLSLGNLYGWMAYSIYDDILDMESGPSRLPIANFFLRKLTELYRDIEVSIPGSFELFTEIMNNVDSGNAWEGSRFKLAKNIFDLPDLEESLSKSEPFSNIADKSFGHSLGPLAQLLALGYDKKSSEFRSIASGLKHYLIARQLHDDAHDWADDLSHDRLNAASILLIRKFEIVHSSDDQYLFFENAHLQELLPRLKVFFWENTIDEIADLIFSYATKGRREFKNSGLFVSETFADELFKPLESSLRQTLNERSATLRFLEEYFRSNN